MGDIEFFTGWEIPMVSHNKPSSKIIAKIPMEKMVLTECGQVWVYEIINKKPIYWYKCSVQMKKAEIKID